MAVGDWVDEGYGSAGYVLWGWTGGVEDLSGVPATYNIDAGSNFDGGVKVDTKFIEKDDASERRWNTVFHGVAVNIVFTFSGSWSGDVRQYIVDDGGGRSCTVDIEKNGSNIFSQSFNTTEYDDGQWITLSNQSFVNTDTLRIIVTRTTGVNAVISGTFFGGDTSVSSGPASIEFGASGSLSLGKSINSGDGGFSLGSTGSVTSPAYVAPTFFTSSIEEMLRVVLRPANSFDSSCLITTDLPVTALNVRNGSLLDSSISGTFSLHDLPEHLVRDWEVYDSFGSPLDLPLNILSSPILPDKFGGAHPRALTSSGITDTTPLIGWLEPDYIAVTVYLSGVVIGHGVISEANVNSDGTVSFSARSHLDTFAFDRFAAAQFAPNTNCQTELEALLNDLPWVGTVNVAPGFIGSAPNPEITYDWDYPTRIRELLNIQGAHANWSWGAGFPWTNLVTNVSIDYAPGITDIEASPPTQDDYNMMSLAKTNVSWSYGVKSLGPKSYRLLDREGNVVFLIGTWESEYNGGSWVHSLSDPGKYHLDTAQTIIDFDDELNHAGRYDWAGAAPSQPIHQANLSNAQTLSVQMDLAGHDSKMIEQPRLVPRVGSTWAFDPGDGYGLQPIRYGMFCSSESWQFTKTGARVSYEFKSNRDNLHG